MSRWAVFDIDGTLLPHSSMEKLFIRSTLKKKLLPKKNFANFIGRGMFYYMAGGWTKAVRANKTYLQGLSANKVDEITDKVFPEFIAPAFSREGISLIESLREDEYKILIMSGAPVFLSSRLGKIYHPDAIFGTELEIINGIYTGKISGKHIYGKYKATFLKKMKSELEIAFKESTAYANHHSDVFHMKLFGNAVAVNPTRRLKDFARRKGWEIKEW